MRITINGKGMEVSDYIRSVAEKRVAKLERYFHDSDVDAEVMLSMFRGRHVAEITVVLGGVVLRAEEVTGDMYASIDNACNKLEKQIERHRTRLEKRWHGGSDKLPANDEIEEDDDFPKIVKTKRFAIKPMGIDEAALQLELLGHEFFVFTNAETSEVNVIYKRHDGDFGLIEPEYI